MLINESTDNIGEWQVHQLHVETRDDLKEMFTKMNLAQPKPTETVEQVCLRYGTEFTRTLMLLVMTDQQDDEASH